jgi:alpha-mannosidase
VPTAPLGETAFRIGQGEASPAAGRAVHAAGRTLENGIVSVTVADDGTFCLVGADGTRLEGLGRIVDGGDRGDSYNYAPPAHDALVERPSDVAVELREAGPLRAAIAVRRSYDIPVGLSDDPDHRAAATRQTVVETVIELRAGEPMVHVHVEFVNVARDHRLRFHLPLPETVDGSRSSGQFAVTERGLTGEGGWGEFPLPTYPAYEFASAGPATVLVRHATEYEVVDGRELALTLLRAVGSISVNVHPLRDEPAASVIPIPGAQELGTTITADFAILAHAGGYRGADAVAWSERFRSDPLVVRGAAPRETALPEPTSRFSLEGESVVLASLRPVDGATELRLVCMSDEPRQARITGAFGSVTTTDLLGRTLGHEAVDGAWQAGLGPWEIRTLRLAR